MEDERRTYRIEQLGRPGAGGIQQNEEVASLDGLVTHHPGANRNIRMQNDAILDAENPARRSHAYISGDFEEVIDNRVDRYGTLQPGQVLLVKDFILEDPDPPRGTDARAVDVPSPTSGYINIVRAEAGFVEIKDREGGVVVARLRHLSDIRVEQGSDVVYGQAIGQQDNLGLNRPAGVGMHIHIEMDTGHYRQFQNYMSDLAGGRLPVQSRYRDGVQPQPVIDDGTWRLGQSSDQIRALQYVMTGEGYRAAGGAPLDLDGVYRPGMQGPLLDFQRDHFIPQTGDVDPQTLRFVPMSCEVARNPRSLGGWQDVIDGFLPPIPEPARAPGHPDHPDHRPVMPAEPAPAINRREEHAFSFDNLQLDQLMAACNANDASAIAKAFADMVHSPQGEAWLQNGQAQLAAQEAQEQQQMETALQKQGFVLARG